MLFGKADGYMLFGKCATRLDGLARGLDMSLWTKDFSVAVDALLLAAATLIHDLAFDIPFWRSWHSLRTRLR